MSKEFTKIYGGFFLGTIARETADTRICFAAMLYLSDADGIVTIAPDGLARFANIELASVELALEKLSSPDPGSTSPDDEGRRIAKWGDGQNQWRIVNHRLYYEKSRNEDRKAYKKEWEKKNAGTRNWRSDPNLKRGTSDTRPTNPTRPTVKESKVNKRKEKETRGALGIVEALGFDSLREIAGKYDRLRKEKNLPKWKPVTCETKIKEWGEFTEKEIGAALYASVSNEWTGVFPKRSSETNYDQV